MGGGGSPPVRLGLNLTLGSNCRTLLVQQCGLTNVEQFDIPSQQCRNVCDQHDQTKFVFWFLSNIPAQRSPKRSPKLTYHKRATGVLGKCHFLPGGGAPENWGDQILCLRSKGGIKRFFQIKKGDHLYFLKK